MHACLVHAYYSYACRRLHLFIILYFWIITGTLLTSIPVPGPHGNVHIFPQQPITVAESVICRSAQWLQWRIVFEDSPDITMEYISSDPVGHTYEATGNGLSFTFNLTLILTISHSWCH